MSKAGPYQYCEKCKTEKPHQWIDVLVIKCITCSLETKVQAANPIEKAISELTPVNEPVPINKVVQPPKPEQPKAKEPKGESQVFETELPMQGHLIKPTPLEVKEFGTHKQQEQAVEIKEVGIELSIPFVAKSPISNWAEDL